MKQYLLFAVMILSLNAECAERWSKTKVYALRLAGISNTFGIASYTAYKINQTRPAPNATNTPPLPTFPR